MTKQEAIKVLDSERKEYIVKGCKLDKAIDMAIAALQDDWIPVSKGLPEDGYWLQSAVGGEVKKDFYYRGHWEIAEDFGYEVVAWKPLPAPYNESEDI